MKEKPKKNLLAVISFVLGSLSFAVDLFNACDDVFFIVCDDAFFVSIFSLLGIIFGIASLKDIKLSGESGRNFAVLGIVISSLYLARIVWDILNLYFFYRGQ